MKKNMVVILIVIGVIGVVVYLLKDRLKVLLGKRAEREEIGEGQIDPYIRHERLGLLNGPIYRALPVGPMIELRQFKTPVTVEAAFKLRSVIYEEAARWIGADIVEIVKEIYPKVPRHGAVLKSLVIFKKGEGQIDPYIRHERLGLLNGPIYKTLPVGLPIELR
ncbi:hypothetical protein ES702_01921 [subsurface metagenome]